MREREAAHEESRKKVSVDQGLMSRRRTLAGQKNTNGATNTAESRIYVENVSDDRSYFLLR